MLRTKIHRPPVTREHVYRDHLIDLLDKNLYKPCTLVSAGAGYGKSMLVSSWVEKSKIPCAWLSISDDDNDLRIFIEGLTASIGNKFPNVLDHLNDYIEAAELPPLNKIAESLINGLDEIDKEYVLVLDDYHLIQNKQINELIDKLLHFPPQLMQLVLICRSDPFLNLHSLRARSRLNEIRMADLCFNESEIIELLKNCLLIESSIELSQRLMQKTEGWITGLRMLLLMVKEGEDPKEAIEKIYSINPSTTNFLLEEVIINQPEPVRNCLIIMSILNRFCDELIDEVCISKLKVPSTEISGKDIIQTLLKANLFTISVDHKHKWYRFHHLFQEILQHQLKKQYSIEEINAFHLAASEWFDKNGFKEVAVMHAIEAKEIKAAVDLVIGYRYEMMEKGQIHRFNHLIDLLPENILEETPALLTAKSFIMEYRGQMAEWIGFKEKAKALLSKISIESPAVNNIRGEVGTIEGELFLLSGDGKNAYECSQKALELLPATASYALSYAWGTQIVSHQLVNNIEGLAKITIENTLKSEFFNARIHGWYCIAYAMQGDTVNLKKHAQKSIELSEKNLLHESVVYAKYFLSVAHYLSMEGDRAEPYLQSVVHDPYIARPHFLTNCAFLLSSIYIEKGEVEKADQLMAFIINHTENSKDSLVTAMSKAMQVELAVKENNIEKALLLDKQQDSYVFFPPLWFIYVSQLTPVKLKLAINTTESVTEALQLLSEIEVPLRQTNKNTILIDVLILQAVALKAQEKEKDALLKITEALSLSSFGNCIRTYVDYGIELKDLLAGLSETHEHKAHIRNILEAISVKENKLFEVTKTEQSRKSVYFSVDDTPERLSIRELEVINLVAKGLRNKEIAELLFVQTDTIKQHLKNSFAKLKVPNRLMAVSRAEELNLINKA